jgi:hypothetical protein
MHKAESEGSNMCRTKGASSSASQCSTCQPLNQSAFISCSNTCIDLIPQVAVAHIRSHFGHIARTNLLLHKSTLRLARAVSKLDRASFAGLSYNNVLFSHSIIPTSIKVSQQTDPSVRPPIIIAVE